MKPIDARALPGSTHVDTDIGIIGPGAAGVALAREFAEASRDVCIVESGADRTDGDTQALYDLDSVGYPIRPNFMNRARYFGGSSNLWAGRCMRLDPSDFERREWISGSGW